MDGSLEHSRAFRHALLQSEKFRTIAVLGVLAAVLLFLTIRSAGDADRTLAISSFALILAVAGVEAALLAAIVRRLRDGGALPPLLWPAAVILEQILPTGGIWLQSRSPEIGPIPALLSPSLLLYSAFLLLTVLRLQPRLCLLSGGVAAAGHLALVLSALSDPEAQPPLPRIHYFLVAPGLLALGAAATAVAYRLREHVEAALREAETKRRMEELESEFSVAKSIQASLLPQEPYRRDGHEIYGWTRPAAHTGGDYFDWLPLADGTIAFSIADVAGHGLGPTLVTVGCRAYARASLGAASEPARTIERVNELLLADMPPGRFVTFALGCLQTATGVVELLSAGHGPIVHISPAHGTAHFLKAATPPLGILPIRISGGLQRVELAKGDSLVLATDGFHEWQGEGGELFGLERLERTLLAGARLPPSEMVAALLAAVERFGAGTTQADDLTAVVVRRDDIQRSGH